MMRVAQLVERWIVVPVAEGSNPSTHPKGIVGTSAGPAGRGLAFSPMSDGSGQSRREARNDRRGWMKPYIGYRIIRPVTP